MASDISKFTGMDNTSNAINIILPITNKNN